MYDATGTVEGVRGVLGDRQGLREGLTVVALQEGTVGIWAVSVTNGKDPLSLSAQIAKS